MLVVLLFWPDYSASKPFTGDNGEEDQEKAAIVLKILRASNYRDRFASNDEIEIARSWFVHIKPVGWRFTKLDFAAPGVK